MEQGIVSRIDNLISQLNQLKADFDNGILSGKPYADIKEIYTQMKELEKLVSKISSGEKTAIPQQS